MIKVNFLPWREAKRKQNIILYGYIALAAALAAVALTIAIHFSLNRLITHQTDRNTYILENIQTMDRNIRNIRTSKATHQRITSQMDVIGQLEESRFSAVKIFQELAQIIPKGIDLISIDYQDQNIVMTGNADSNARVSELMKNIIKSNWFTRPTLSEIKKADNSTDPSVFFKLTLIPILNQSTIDSAPKEKKPL